MPPLLPHRAAASPGCACAPAPPCMCLRPLPPSLLALLWPCMCAVGLAEARARHPQVPARRPRDLGRRGGQRAAGGHMPLNPLLSPLPPGLSSLPPVLPSHLLSSHLPSLLPPLLPSLLCSLLPYSPPIFSSHLLLLLYHSSTSRARSPSGRCPLAWRARRRPTGTAPRAAPSPSSTSPAAAVAAVVVVVVAATAAARAWRWFAPRRVATR